MTTTVGVVLFPGSNCEFDVIEAINTLGGEARLVWHGERRLRSFDALILPGGFAHGDYLRPGAIARFSPIMKAIERFAAGGAPVVGICNGFQILTEAHLLPGALQKNRGLTFLCQPVQVEVTSSRSVLTSEVPSGQRLRIPINHFEGNYICDMETLAELRAEDRVVLRYVENPNGSIDDIAGICNAAGNVVGLMPHPERATDGLLGSDDGCLLLRSLLHSAATPGMPAGAAAGVAAGSAHLRSDP
jgi:phosphoribosylformylglycinamidine synthase